MLYEKTLSRKIISLPAAKQEEELEPAPNGYSADLSTDHQSRNVGLWKKTLCFLKGPLQSRLYLSKHSKRQDLKAPASMGKILNLMRYVLFISRLGRVGADHKPAMMSMKFLKGMQDFLSQENLSFVANCISCLV